MNAEAITLKAMQNTSAKEFGDIARMQHKTSGVCGNDLCLAEINAARNKHTDRAEKDYGMDAFDAERWAWLNTLFGYDIGADRAKGVIKWYDDNGLDVLDLGADNKEELKEIAKELGYHFNFSSFAPYTPDDIGYSWPDHI